MKYNEDQFNAAVDEYKKAFKNHKKTSILVLFNHTNKTAFLSLAPLSRALHELKCDVCCIGHHHDKTSIEVLHDIWEAYHQLQKKERNEHTQALSAFIDQLEKKKINANRLFSKPHIVLEATQHGFHGIVSVPFLDKWFVAHREEELEQTASILWADVYNIAKHEKVGIGFELVPLKENLGHPLEDYLDSYAISWAMIRACPGQQYVSATTSRTSMLEPMEKVSDMRATLLGCELTKEVDQEPFSSYRELSEVLQLHRLITIDASFSVHGKGYPGKHEFGDKIGYPSPNGKTKWKSPGQILFKLDFYPQTKLDDRDPRARVAFTETLPIDVFIETNLIDWIDLRNRNQRVKEIMDQCDVIFVKGKLNEKYVTNLEVGLVKPDGTRRWVRRSDTDVRQKINEEYLKRTGIRAGCMGNIPGGEAFTTPEYIKGMFVGDVVIAIDQSYPLKKEDPFVVECFGDHYKIVTAPKNELAQLEKRKKEAWDLLKEAEKHKSLPQDIIDMKKKNFERIGEFAINTNPKAQLCEYLIVNEKIAKMMHIALGSGYEEDRSTDYHVDIVFDAPRQKLDVYGKDAQGNTYWILRDGQFAA